MCVHYELTHCVCTCMYVMNSQLSDAHEMWRNILCVMIREKDMSNLYYIMLYIVYVHVCNVRIINRHKWNMAECLCDARRKTCKYCIIPCMTFLVWVSYTVYVHVYKVWKTVWYSGNLTASLSEDIGKALVKAAACHYVCVSYIVYVFVSYIVYVCVSYIVDECVLYIVDECVSYIVDECVSYIVYVWGLHDCGH